MAVIIKRSDVSCAEKAGEMLRSGLTGVFPCDTIYGLSAKVSETGAERIYEIKRRPRSKSFITLMTLSDLDASGLIVPDDIRERWPAPLTAILKDGDGNSHAVRVPDDDFVQEILSVSGPVYSTSVNFSGEGSLLTFDDIFPVFDSLVDFIIEDPSISGGMPSTLVDATEKPYRVLRQGAYII